MVQEEYSCSMCPASQADRMANIKIDQPNLKIVPIERALLHERVDPLRVQRLVDTMRLREKLKNPIVVAEADEAYIVLDGATRTTALRQLGIRTALVQIVNYEKPKVRLHSWHHAVIGLTDEFLLQELKKIRVLEMEASDLKDLRKRISQRHILFGFVTPNRRLAFSSDGDRPSKIELLNRVVDIYAGRAEVQRVLESDLLKLRDRMPDVSAIFLFPRFTPEEIILGAKNQKKIPPGISRHLIHGRALRVNLPLAILASDQSLEEKNAWLQQFMSAHYQKKVIRAYEETTVVFDDG